MADTAISIAQPESYSEAKVVDRKPRWPPLWLLLGVVGFGVALYFTGSLTAAGWANFRIIFGSLILQAIPLVMMGAFVAAIIGTFAGVCLRPSVSSPRTTADPGCGNSRFCVPRV
jgi:hypothetical protein